MHGPVRLARTIGYAVVALFVALTVSMGVPAYAHAEQEADTWSQQAQRIVDHLDSAYANVESGNRAKAAAQFRAAYHSDYVGSNFAKVVSLYLGESRFEDQSEKLQALSKSVYTQGDAESDAQGNTQGNVENGRSLQNNITQISQDLLASGQELDAAKELSSPSKYSQEQAERTQSEREALDKAKTRVNKGKGNRTWSQVAQEMSKLLTHAKQAQGQEASALINEAYYQYYEKLGFEKNVMNAISGDRVSLVESTFKESRKAKVAGEESQANAHIDTLISLLEEDAATLDGGQASTTSNALISAVTSSFGQALLILLREGLEALLVVAAIISYLIKTGHTKFVRWIYVGVVAGLAASGVVAVLLAYLFGGSGPQQEALEGVCALIAVALLLYTSNWMLTKASVQSWNTYIQNSAHAAVDERVGTASVIQLASLSFLAVFREGAETVIFYQSIYSMTSDATGMWAGGITAGVILVVIFFIFRFTSLRLPLRPFFVVTSVLMAALVVIFAGGGVHSLIEADALPATYLPSVHTNEWIGLYPYAQTLIAQGIALVAVAVLFAVGLRKERKANHKVKRQANQSAEQQSNQLAEHK